MTVISARVYSDHLEMYADSGISDGSSLIQGVEKIVELSYGLVAGAGLVGSVDFGTRIFQAHNGLTVRKDPRVLYGAIANQLKESDLGETEWLLAAKEGCYYFDSYGACRLLGDRATIGSGAAYALGALACSAKIKAAVEIACSYDMACAFPVTGKVFEFQGLGQ